MAGDNSTELLFLDTFKHQNSEVVILSLLSPFYVCSKYALNSIVLRGFESAVLNFHANDINVANISRCVAIVAILSLFNYYCSFLDLSVPNISVKYMLAVNHCPYTDFLLLRPYFVTMVGQLANANRLPSYSCVFVSLY